MKRIHFDDEGQIVDENDPTKGIWVAFVVWIVLFLILELCSK